MVEGGQEGNTPSFEEFWIRPTKRTVPSLRTPDEVKKIAAQGGERVPPVVLKAVERGRRQGEHVKTMTMALLDESMFRECFGEEALNSMKDYMHYSAGGFKNLRKGAKRRLRKVTGELSEVLGGHPSEFVEASNRARIKEV